MPEFAHILLEDLRQSTDNYASACLTVAAS
jgi:hypothetical protein